MQRSFWISLLIAIAGCVLVALPDTGVPVIRFNDRHGPSLQDMIGLVLLIGAWLWMFLVVILRRYKVLQQLGRNKLLFLLILIVAGIALITGGIQFNNDVLLWIGILLSLQGNALVIIPAFKMTK